MLCTLSAVPAAGVHASPRELYLRALEHERLLILQHAYAQKGAPFPASSSSSSSSATPPAYNMDSASYFSDHEQQHHVEPKKYDDKGRLLDFRESVRQRQARLEFIRRQEFARRLAIKGLTDPKASEYAIDRLPPPRARPAERLNAAIKIQRTYRAHKAATTLLRKLDSLADDLDYTARDFESTHAHVLSSNTTPVALRRAHTAVRNYSSALARIRLDVAELTRPLRNSSSCEQAHEQTVSEKLRALNASISENIESLERAKVDVGVREMRTRIPKRSGMWAIEESAEEEDDEDEFEEENEKDLKELLDQVYVISVDDIESPSSSVTSSPATSLATLSDASLDELSEGEHQHIEVRTLEDDEDALDFEFSHHEYYTSAKLPTIIDEDEDEDEEDGDDVSSLRRTLALSLLFSASQRQQKKGHARKSAALLSAFDLSVAGKSFSRPVSRSPSLGSIEEEDDE